MNKLAKLSKSARGITLIELLIAMAMLAWITVVAQVVIQTAGRSGEVSERTSQQLKDIDRTWILLETDLRNAVGVNLQIPFSEPLPAMRVSETEEYILSFVRAGQSNPLLLPRSEVLRVGYRLEENVLWRDSWIDPYNPIEELARPQQLLDTVESIEVRVLPPAPTGRSVDSGPWLDEWPSVGQGSAILPLAVEVTLTLVNRREDAKLRRVITLVPGA